MKSAHNDSRKFCFISNSDQSYLADYVDFSRFDKSLDFSFDNINLTELKDFNPDIIIIDQYFYKKDCSLIKEMIKLNFNSAQIYFFSPEYANYNNVIQSVNNKKHFYSNFSVDIIAHINSISNKNYLEAS